MTFLNMVIISMMFYVSVNSSWFTKLIGVDKAVGVAQGIGGNLDSFMGLLHEDILRMTLIMEDITNLPEEIFLELKETVGEFMGLYEENSMWVEDQFGRIFDVGMDRVFERIAGIFQGDVFKGSNDRADSMGRALDLVDALKKHDGTEETINYLLRDIIQDFKVIMKNLASLDKIVDRKIFEITEFVDCKIDEISVHIHSFFLDALLVFLRGSLEDDEFSHCINLIGHSSLLYSLAQPAKDILPFYHFSKCVIQTPIENPLVEVDPTPLDIFQVYSQLYQNVEMFSCYAKGNFFQQNIFYEEKRQISRFVELFTSFGNNATYNDSRKFNEKDGIASIFGDPTISFDFNLTSAVSEIAKSVFMELFASNPLNSTIQQFTRSLDDVFLQFNDFSVNDIIQDTVGTILGSIGIESIIRGIAERTEGKIDSLNLTEIVGEAISQSLDKMNMSYLDSALAGISNSVKNSFSTFISNLDLPSELEGVIDKVIDNIGMENVESAIDEVMREFKDSIINWMKTRMNFEHYIYKFINQSIQEVDFLRINDEIELLMEDVRMSLTESLHNLDYESLAESLADSSTTKIFDSIPSLDQSVEEISNIIQEKIEGIETDEVINIVMVHLVSVLENYEEFRNFSISTHIIDPLVSKIKELVEDTVDRVWEEEELDNIVDTTDYVNYTLIIILVILFLGVLGFILFAILFVVILVMLVCYCTIKHTGNCVFGKSLYFLRKEKKKNEKRKETMEIECQIESLREERRENLVTTKTDFDHKLQESRETWNMIMGGKEKKTERRLEVMRKEFLKLLETSERKNRQLLEQVQVQLKMIGENKIKKKKIVQRRAIKKSSSSSSSSTSSSCEERFVRKKKATLPKKKKKNVVHKKKKSRVVSKRGKSKAKKKKGAVGRVIRRNRF